MSDQSIAKPDDKAFAERFVCELADLSVLQVTGADAETFLQGQMTNNIAALKLGTAQRTGFCSPKGRLLADFIAIRGPQSYFLLLDGSLADTVRKRLSMYVLRAKVVFEDITGSRIPVGFVDRTAPATAGADSPPNGGQLPSALLPWPAPMQTTIDATTLAVGLETVTLVRPAWRRVIALLAPTEAAAVLAGSSTDWDVAPAGWWHTGEVLAGTPRIVAATSDAFVPQMINFELVGGVDFKKGCYTGQEVVARTQYLGKMKRRLSIGWSAGAGAPGDPVTDTAGDIIGTVLACGPGTVVGRPDDFAIQFESRIEALEAPLNLHHRPLALASLPYEIPVVERFERPRGL